MGAVGIVPYGRMAGVPAFLIDHEGVRVDELARSCCSFGIIEPRHTIGHLDSYSLTVPDVGVELRESDAPAEDSIVST